VEKRTAGTVGATHLQPDAPAIGFQRWDSLLFLHWPVPVEVLRPLAPARLRIDTFEGHGYVSITPFTLVGARLRGMPPVPGLTRFHELNVRTYVRLREGDPAIWFFSLEAASPLAAGIARATLRLPYTAARMTREQHGPTHRYFCERRLPRHRPGRFAASWEVEGPASPAAPGTLAFFLAERYLLYSRALGSKLWRVQVRHPPWPLHAVRALHVEQSLDRADGLPPLGPPALAHYSEGVDVEFLPFHLV
jgi:uncharacterized protein YqjF (DUF2071 family)